MIAPECLPLIRYVSEASMWADALMMKKYNFNATRCSHYPNATRWYATSATSSLSPSRT